MALDLDLQLVSECGGIPAEDTFRTWAAAALQGRAGNLELVIRVVDEPEIRALNRDFRGKDSATNVLAFPFEAPPPVPSALIGDVVLCAPVVQRESVEQAKPPLAHWAHMVVHGVLHLLGYDHVEEREARRMEDAEREILARLGFPDPYEPY